MVKPTPLMTQVRAIAIGAAKEFRENQKYPQRALQKYLGSVCSYLLQNKGLVYRTELTAGGVRVTRIE